MLRQYLDNINRINIFLLFVFQITGSSGILPTISVFHFERVTFNTLNKYKPSDYIIGKIYYYNKTTNLQNNVKLILIFELVLLTNIPEKAFEIPPSPRWTPLTLKMRNTQSAIYTRIYLCVHEYIHACMSNEHKRQSGYKITMKQQKKARENNKNISYPE